MNKLILAAQNALKAFTMRWGGSRWGWTALTLGGTSYNYATAASTGYANAAVMACIRWVCRTFPEAPIQVHQLQADDDPKDLPGHPLVQLLERPNPYYSGLALWTATLADLMLTGNAYWGKVRTGNSRIAQLWWLPAAQMEPRWPEGLSDNTTFVTHYDYEVDGQVQPIRPEDVVHFRDGWDPRNIRKGLSPLASLYREIATDDEAANFTATLLRNLGVPGVVIAPMGDVTATDEDLDEVKTKFAQRFGGDRRGEPLVLKGPASVSVLSFSPEQMQTRESRRIPEERITAIFGTPAVVVGLGAGLDRSTYSNMAEAREAAYESLMIPLQRGLLADLQHQLVPDFGDPSTLRLAHDYTAVRVLQADHNAVMERAVRGYQGGVLTRGEARLLVGQDASPDDDVFLQSNNFSLLAMDAAPPDPDAAVPPSTEDAVPTPLPVAAGLDAAELKALAPEAGIFTREALERAEAFADDLGLAPLLEATASPNGHGGE